MGWCRVDLNADSSEAELMQNKGIYCRKGLLAKIGGQNRQDPGRHGKHMGPQGQNTGPESMGTRG